ncbi:peroxisomal oxidase [Melanogaster broomeanus]|nr:peroxisomal oxidase [Melanogaster broomeanus]
MSILSEVLPVHLHGVGNRRVTVHWTELGDLNISPIRCYLQTELGHGTNVARLETTATYHLPDIQEFEIYSPSLTSTKWWVEDHTLLPGITAGDIRPKLHGLTMISTAGWTLARGKASQSQFVIPLSADKENPMLGLERQVITYPSTNYRLLPIISRSYVFIGLGRQTTLGAKMARQTKAFSTLGERIDEGDFAYLAEIYATLCGLKVLVSTSTVRDLETTRRAMGGHGYSAFAGIERLYADCLPAVTSRSLTSYSNYLRLLKGDSPKRPIISESTWQDSRAIMHLLEWRTALAVQNYAQTVDETDAGINQRLAKAITEALVVTQVGEIADLKTLPQSGARALGDLYHLRSNPRPSALGVFDGHVYEELWRRVQLEPLNQIDGTPGYEIPWSNYALFSVSHLCFELRRITMSPALVLTRKGLSTLHRHIGSILTPDETRRVIWTTIVASS